ncbi:hypothetical protein [Novosphingobium sp. 9U]|uniref:hypothetical protein n=1 Tax=Novosphingobium sp. 9U TaxID=2653158 RepID=UPI0012F3C588|nr:hypothetical protein [Novosphingobium sp. 9U]VWX54417.1 hypothetical protein NOVOSPHI9U_620005 [Novosphingobium sp. 9U]
MVVTYYPTRLEITVTDRAISVGDIDTSGVIASVQDFRNAQVFVSLTPTADAWKDTPWSSYAKIGPNIHLQKVNIRIGGREFQIDGKSMQADRLKGALPLYAGHFSES